MIIVYRVIDGVLKGWRKRPDDYVLKPNEIIGGDFKKPAYIDGEIIETWSAEDQDEFDENLAEQTAAEQLEQFENDGLAFSKVWRAQAKRRLDTGNITGNQYKTIRNLLMPVFAHLRHGEWDIGQDVINEIDPPQNPKLLKLYNKVKNKINSYLSQ